MSHPHLLHIVTGCLCAAQDPLYPNLHEYYDSGAGTFVPEQDRPLNASAMQYLNHAMESIVADFPKYADVARGTGAGCAMSVCGRA